MTKEGEKTEEDAAFAGLERGKHWQFCPKEGCRRRVELSEACNHIVCGFCDTGFCFICGEKADEDSDHWIPGGCPRYGQPDSPTAGFDGGATDYGDDGERDERLADDEAAWQAGNLPPPWAAVPRAAAPEEQEVGEEQKPTVVDGVELSADEQADDEAVWNILRVDGGGATAQAAVW
ncbi:hypothetical protein LTR85_011065 [Meristemomyces frigidus]|nr:hypothetical protein LTR85_011065 [Meristemomyces frigidus]